MAMFSDDNPSSRDTDRDLGVGMDLHATATVRVYALATIVLATMFAIANVVPCGECARGSVALASGARHG
jgi:hypothetical protein